MSKKSVEERKKDSNHLKIIFSVLIMGISLLAELYTMIVLEGNPIYLAIFGLVFLLFSYLLISSIMQNQYIQSRIDKEDHEGLLKSEKASYLIVKKSFDEIFQRLDALERGIQIPTEELITAQKAIAKVNINRSKENTDALMNSNDLLLEKVMGFEQVLNNNNQKLLDGQSQNMEQQLQDVILKQQELSSAIKEMQLSLKNEILQAVNTITISQPQIMVQSPVAPAANIPAVEDSVQMPTEETVEETMLQETAMEDMLVEEPSVGEQLMEESLMEEPLVEEPLMEETITEEPLVNEPLMEEPLVEEALTEEPLVEEPLVDETAGNTLMDELLAGQPSIEEPVAEEPLTNELLADESEVEEPLMNELLTEEPAVEEPLMEESSTEEPAAEEPSIDLSDPNKMMSPDDIAALIANVSSSEEPAPEIEEPIVEMEETSEEPEEADEEILIPDMSDPNKMMSPDEIAALIANL